MRNQSMEEVAQSKTSTSAYENIKEVREKQVSLKLYFNRMGKAVLQRSKARQHQPSDRI
jgi:hypothetical protein